jgi:hypothetical protein
MRLMKGVGRIERRSRREREEEGEEGRRIATTRGGDPAIIGHWGLLYSVTLEIERSLVRKRPLSDVSSPAKPPALA